MIELIHRRAIGKVLVAMAAVCWPLAAEAATIHVILSDMDVAYFGDAAGNTGSIYDMIGHPGGNLNPAEADVVETVVFERDTTHVGTLMNTEADTLYGDLRINGVGSSLPLGPFQTGLGNNGGGFGFDWFNESGNNLRLGIDTVDVLLTNNVFFFTGTATVLSQNLPFGLLGIGPQVVFSYTATLPGIMNGVPPTGAIGSGALTISGIEIPEPGTTVWVSAAVAIAAASSIRRRRWRLA